jgi:hypothetical protein
MMDSAALAEEAHIVGARLNAQDQAEFVVHLDEYRSDDMFETI